MSGRVLLRLVGAAVAVAVVGAGLVALAGETKSRHTTQPADSRLHVELEAELRPGSGKALPDLVRSLVVYCQAEVAATVTEAGIETTAEERFAFTLAPSLDQSDRRQLQGCLEDATVDHLTADVTGMDHEEDAGARATGRSPDR